MLLVISVLLLAVAPLDPYRTIDQNIAQQAQYWDITAKEPRMIVSKQSKLPPNVDIMNSNNCLSIALFESRLFIAWRSAPTHFASKKTRIFIMSSNDNGISWSKENEIFMQSDMRQPYLIVLKNRLFFYFFQAGTNPAAFQPNSLFRTEYLGIGNWSKPQSWGQAGEIAWQYQVENDTLYAMSYLGDHYGLQFPKIKVYFNKSYDGVRWEPCDAKNPVIYVGGISQIGWMFDLQGYVYGVGRNEDGDSSGWGRRVMNNINGTFKFYSNASDPNIIQSPRMFRHGDDLYLVGRTDPTGQFQNNYLLERILPRNIHHYIDLGWYSLRPHGNAIWKVLKNSGKLLKVLDLPGCGDTSFPSIIRTGQHTYWLANYSSPLDECQFWPWIVGQTSKEGTQIHIIELTFI